MYIYVIQGVGLSLSSPLTLLIICIAGSTTCPCPVQLDALTIYLVACCMGALVCLQISMTSL